MLRYHILTHVTEGLILSNGILNQALGMMGRGAEGKKVRAEILLKT